MTNLFCSDIQNSFWQERRGKLWFGLLRHANSQCSCPIMLFWVCLISSHEQRCCFFDECETIMESWYSRYDWRNTQRSWLLLWYRKGCKSVRSGYWNFKGDLAFFSKSRGCCRLYEWKWSKQSFRSCSSYSRRIIPRMNNLVMIHRLLEVRTESAPESLHYRRSICWRSTIPDKVCREWALWCSISHSLGMDSQSAEPHHENRLWHCQHLSRLIGLFGWCILWVVALHESEKHNCCFGSRKQWSSLRVCSRRLSKDLGAIAIPPNFPTSLASDQLQRTRGLLVTWVVEGSPTVSCIRFFKEILKLLPPGPLHGCTMIRTQEMFSIPSVESNLTLSLMVVPSLLLWLFRWKYYVCESLWTLWRIFRYQLLGCYCVWTFGACSLGDQALGASPMESVFIDLFLALHILHSSSSCSPPGTGSWNVGLFTPSIPYERSWTVSHSLSFFDRLDRLFFLSLFITAAVCTTFHSRTIGITHRIQSALISLFILLWNYSSITTCCLLWRLIPLSCLYDCLEVYSHVLVDSCSISFLWLLPFVLFLFGDVSAYDSFISPHLKYSLHNYDCIHLLLFGDG